MSYSFDTGKTYTLSDTSAHDNLEKMKSDRGLTKAEVDAAHGLTQLGGSLRRPSNIYGLGYKSAITMSDIHHHLGEVNTKANELHRNPANSRKPNHHAHALMMRHHYDFEKSHGVKGGAMDESGVIGGGFNPASLLPLLAFL